MNPVIYIFINKSLGMSVGKAAAQTAHATMLVTDYVDKNVWLKAIHKTVIVLEARDENHMKNIQQYLNKRNFACHEVIDEGVNEIDPHTWTAMSSNILNKDDEDVIKAFSTFKLYKDFITFTVRSER